MAIVVNPAANPTSEEIIKSPSIEGKRIWLSNVAGDASGGTVRFYFRVHRPEELPLFITVDSVRTYCSANCGIVSLHPGINATSWADHPSGLGIALCAGLWSSTVELVQSVYIPQEDKRCPPLFIGRPNTITANLVVAFTTNTGAAMYQVILKTTHWIKDPRKLYHHPCIFRE